MIILLVIIALLLGYLVLNSIIDTMIGGVAGVIVLILLVFSSIKQVRKEADESGKKPNEELEQKHDLHISYHN